MSKISQSAPKPTVPSLESPTTTSTVEKTLEKSLDSALVQNESSFEQSTTTTPTKSSSVKRSLPRSTKAANGGSSLFSRGTYQPQTTASQRTVSADATAGIGVGANLQGVAAGAAATAESGAADKSSGGLELHRGALIPPPIDSSKLGLVDSALVEGMNLDNIPPGGSLSLKGGLSAEGAVFFGGQAGGEVEYTISRSAEDPNKFTMSVGGGLKTGINANVDSTAGVAGFDAGAKLSANGGAKVEMSIDLSKPGEATELAGFLAHTAAAGTLPASVTTAVNLVESIPGVDVPGEPANFLRDHVSALEVGGGVEISGDLAGAIFGGAAGELTGYLQGGGRIEFNEDGTKTLSANALVGADLKVKGKGGDALYAQIDAANFKGEVGVESKLTLDENWKPQSVSYGLSLSGSGSVAVPPATVGVGVKGGVSLDALKTQNPQAAQRLEEAIRSGDPLQVRNVLMDPTLELDKITFSGGVTGNVSVAGDVGGKVKEFGAGGEVKFSGGIGYSHPIANGEFSFGREGIEVKGGMEGGLFRVTGEGNVSYDEILDGMQQVNPEDLYFSHVN